MNSNWTCPYCAHVQTVTDSRWFEHSAHINVGGTVEGSLSSCTIAIGCANSDCNKITVTFSIRPDQSLQYEYRVNWDSEPFYNRRVLPENSSKPQPSYIPSQIVEDYVEACMISNYSPKASATLSRRCIQGMIRDFAKISKATLFAEINALRDAVNDGKAPAGVTIETIEAIDHLRSIGNIGAHMERDIDVIVPVDPGEAHALIELIEMLLDEWYVARHRRQERLATIAKISEEKRKIKDGDAAGIEINIAGQQDAK